MEIRSSFEVRQIHSMFLDDEEKFEEIVFVCQPAAQRTELC
jgi:hypothetical protein